MDSSSWSSPAAKTSWIVATTWLVSAWWRMLSTQATARSILVEPCWPGAAGRGWVSRDPTRTLTQTLLAAVSQLAGFGTNGAREVLGPCLSAAAIPFGHGIAGSGNG